jgi:hypothetical protein
VKTTGRSVAHSKQEGGPVVARAALAKAYERVFSGKDGEMVLSDLAAITGYYRRPNYAEWMIKTKGPHGFELHSALCNARAEVMQHVMDLLLMDDDRKVALERAARAESGQ